MPLIFTDPLATAIFGLACLVWLAPEALGMRRQMARVSRWTASNQDRHSLQILVGLQWVGLALSFSLARWVPTAEITWQPQVLLALGVLCILLGVALRWYAIRMLGMFFTRDVAVSGDQQVVQRGPYRLIRHPAYSGTFLTMLGLGLAETNWAGLACLLACVFAGHYYRVTVEEQALVRTLGQPYIDYMRRTRRFIPWLF